MGKKTPQIPAPPDPAQAIAAQGQANQQNIVDLIGANRLNQVTPFGSINFTGGTGPGGVFGQTQEVSLAPDIEATLNNQSGLAKLLSGRGIEAANRIDFGPLDFSGLPQRPGSLDTSGLPVLPGANDQTAERQRLEQELFNRSTALLRPEFDRQRSTTEQTLADRGFDLERSQGAQSALDRLDRSQNASFERAASDAVAGAGSELSRNFGIASQARGQGLAELLADAGLSGDARDAGISEQLLQRGLPLQDIAALAGATPNLPLLQPGGFFTPNTAAPDAIGATFAGHNAALQNAQLQQQARASTFGGITGLLGALGSAAFLSDRRLKTNIRKIGKAGPLSIYKWRWNEIARSLFGLEGGDSGFMAQEVEKVAPEAIVRDPSGYLRIKYAKLAELL